MNKVYDNGAMMIGNIDLVIKEIKREIKEATDMYDIELENLLKDLEDLKVQVPNIDIICIDYDTGMGCSFDYWRKNDEIKEV